MLENVVIETAAADEAEQACREISATLPEWFGLPEANERYALGMRERTSFIAKIESKVAGMLTLEFPYPNNGNIYWMGIERSFHGLGAGTLLLNHAVDYCRQMGCTSLTVETLSAKQQDENYLKTYQFYEKNGFIPLFDMYTYGPDNLMVYMIKWLSLRNLRL